MTTMNFKMHLQIAKHQYVQWTSQSKTNFMIAEWSERPIHTGVRGLQLGVREQKSKHCLSGGRGTRCPMHFNRLLLVRDRRCGAETPACIKGIRTSVSAIPCTHQQFLAPLLAIISARRAIFFYFNSCFFLLVGIVDCNPWYFWALHSTAFIPFPSQSILPLFLPRPFMRVWCSSVRSSLVIDKRVLMRSDSGKKMWGKRWGIALKPSRWHW